MGPRKTGTPRHEELSVFSAGGLYTTLVGIRRLAICGQPLRATTESLCTLPACWTARSALRVHTFEYKVRTHGRSPTSSFLLCSLFSDALGLPREAYLDFPRKREWQEAAAEYRERFEAYAIRPRDVLLRLPNRRTSPRVSGRPPRRMGGTSD